MGEFVNWLIKTKDARLKDGSKASALEVKFLLKIDGA